MGVVRNSGIGSVSSPNNLSQNYVNSNDKAQVGYKSDSYENISTNNDKMTIEQLVDFVQADLTFTGMMPKVLPDLEIQRIIKENALQWFYKNYQWALIKSYYKLDKRVINTDEYTNNGFIILPEECENVVKIYNISDPSIFRFGVQFSNLGMGLSMGVANQPFLTSQVTNIGELATYRQILSGFASELNKLSKLYNKYAYNSESKRLHLLGEVRNDLMLEVYLRIEQEELMNSNLFKDYVVGFSRLRLGQMLQRVTFQLPGNFSYNADSLISQGQELIDKTIESVKNQSPNTSFFIMAQ